MTSFAQEADEEMISALTLLDAFGAIQQVASSDDYTVWSLDKWECMVSHCLRQIQIQGLFSANEQLDDIATESLPYLSLSYHRAKAYLAISNMEGRKDRLLRAEHDLSYFLHAVCEHYQLLLDLEVRKLHLIQPHLMEDDEEHDHHVKVFTAEEQRMFKIDKFKRDRAAKQRIQELKKVVNKVKEDEQAAVDDHEEERRDMYLLTIQCHARDALDELEMLYTEMSMLNMREDEEDLRALTEFSATSSSSSANIPNRAMDPNRPGISITRTYKVGDQLMMSRDTVKTTVFGSRIAPPTMSLEEFADKEREDAIRRQEAEQDAEQGPRKYKDLLAAGEEDREDLADVATIEDRKWDAWKEENQRGSGNKMGKRF